MRFVFALCEVSYSGRGDTTLPLYERAILVKGDGTVSVHSDKGIKPLNYMNGGARGNMVEHVDNKGLKTWTFENSKETLVITFHRIYSDTQCDVPNNDPGLKHDGTESQIQEFLSKNIKILKPEYKFIKREYRTDNGPVDILAYDEAKEKHVLIEVKRVATTSALHQIKKYVDGTTEFDEVDALLVAIDVRPKTREKAAKMGYPWMQLSKDDVSGFFVSEKSDD